MNQCLRLLSLLRNLPRSRGNPDSTATALARQYGVSQRTIYRDIALLQQAGCAVVSDGQGYCILPTDQSLPAALDSSELASLIYASQWVCTAIPEALRPAFASALDKLTAACGTTDAVKAALDQDSGIAVQPPLTDGPSATSNMALAVQARRAHKKLRGVYCSPETGDVTERVLHPYAVVYRGHAHYLVAYCELRGEERTFRLDRFRRLEVLDAVADLPHGYDLDHHFAGAWEVTGGRRRRVRLLVRGETARRLRSSHLHSSQEVVVHARDEIELAFRVALTDEFRGWVLSLGPEAEVLEPPSLRKQICRAARRILSNYAAS